MFTRYNHNRKRKILFLIASLMTIAAMGALASTLKATVLLMKNVKRRKLSVGICSMIFKDIARMMTIAPSVRWPPLYCGTTMIGVTS